MSNTIANEENNAYIDFGGDTAWTEIKIKLPADSLELAESIAGMTVPYGFYVEDYRTLEEETMEIAHIDLIDEDLLKKDRDIGYIHIYLEPEMNPAEAVAFLKDRLDASGIKYETEILICEKEDWQNNWKKYVEPMEIGDRLLIMPDISKRVVDTDRRVLYIEPGLAFGTGTHDTTKLCLSALSERILGGESVLDLGCGSGILALSALLLGASEAEGVDISDIAAKTATENGILNGFTEPQYKIHCGDMTEKITGTYDIVVANIVADIIILFCQNARRFMKPDGIFIVSGIIETREEDVTAAFNEYGFTVIERKESNGWLCFVLN